MAETPQQLVKVVLIEGSRTPFLRANTAFGDLNSYDLARLALLGLMKKTQIDPNLLDRVILGSVISNIETSNVAREAALGAGLPPHIPAFTVTQACISANVAISSAIDLIRTGNAKAVFAGGTESMSDIPIRYRKRFRQKLVESQRYRRPLDYLKFFKGLSWRDWLPEIPTISEFSTGRTMGQDCDRLAARFGITREAQDEFALGSHQKAAQASRVGFLGSEIEPVRVPPKFVSVSGDNGIRTDSTLDKLTSLKPAFVKPGGTVTAGNASFLTDGAAAVLLMEEGLALSLGMQPKAILREYAFSGQDPAEALLLGPAYATAKLLSKSGLSLADIDVFEFHEAFAGQVLANLACLGSDPFARQYLGRESAVGQIPVDRLNTCGGSLSLGHPFGATGARLLTTAANRLIHENGRLALVAACAAGGLGHALLLERYQSA